MKEATETKPVTSLVQKTVLLEANEDKPKLIVPAETVAPIFGMRRKVKSSYYFALRSNNLGSYNVPTW